MPTEMRSYWLRVRRKKWAHVPIYLITADLRAAQRMNTSAPDAPHADGVIEKGAESVHKLRELFEQFREKAGGVITRRGRVISS